MKPHKLCSPKTVLSALVPVLLVACGDDVTNTTNNVTGAKTVADLAAAGTCDATATGEIVLNSEDGALYVCNGKKWITMKGEPGEPGEPGAPGAPGDSGVAGAAGTSCTAATIPDVGIEVSCDGVVVDTLENGEKGDPGEAGASCEATSIAGVGIEISCGGVIIDTLENGAKGDPGNPGAAGTSCEATSIAGVGIEVSCGGVVVDTLKNGEAGASCAGRTIEGVGVEISCGNVVIDTIEFVHVCGNTVYTVADAETHFCDERDGLFYETIRIGSQIWMKTNLNHDYKVEGVSYGSYCWNDSAEYCSRTGRLYTWAAAMDTVNTGCGDDKTCAAATGRVQGVCPDGWHLPDSSEWAALLLAVAGGNLDTAATALKSTDGWYNNGNGSNSSGFTIVPTGYRQHTGEFTPNAKTAGFWASSEWAENYPHSVMLQYSNESASVGHGIAKRQAMSVRCVKNSN